MKSGYIRYKQSDVHYRISGKGDNITLCFHGFGEYARTFDILGDAPGNHCLIAIDLPFHGETEWREGLDITAAELIHMIRQIPELKEGNFGLLGYSMGGRICLSLLQTIPDQITHLVLLAPDGLKVNFWYWLATQTVLGNRLFRYTMSSPGWFNFVLTAAKKTGLVNQSILKFVHRYIDDIQMREKVHNTWITLRSFRPDLTEIKNHVAEFSIPVHLIYGRFDRIILPGPGKRFIRGIEPYSAITLVESGHQVLHPKNIKAIGNAITGCLRIKSSQT